MHPTVKKMMYRIVWRGGWKIKYARSLGVNIQDDLRMICLPDFDSEPYLITIGRYVTLASDIRFVTHEGGHSVLKRLEPEKFEQTFGYGRITIEDNVYIGARTTILRGVTIGENSIVGACSLVNKSLPPNGVYAGVPAKRICSIEEWGEKFLADMPEFDLENYTNNKKDEILKIVDKFRKR